jgi:hypothetical protein
LSALPWRARCYVLALFGTALVAAATTLREHPDATTLLCLGALFALMDPLSTVELGRAVTVSVGFPICLAAVILLGPGGGALVALAGGIWQPGSPTLPKRLFNAAAPACAAAAAAVSYRLLGGESVLTAGDFPRVLPVFLAAAMIYSGLNAVLVAGVLALADQVPFGRAVRLTLSTGMGHLPYGVFGLLMAVLWSRLGGFAVVLGLLPLLVARWALMQHAAVRTAHERTVRALVKAVETKDHYTRGHSERVAHGSQLIGRQIGMAEGRVEQLRFAGMLHDLGKLAVPTDLLLKSGRLTEAEAAILARHPVAGAELIRNIAFLREARDGIVHHHERMDGAGYPLGLRGAEIPEFARVVAVADAFDAMTSTRSYRPARTLPAAMAELRACAGTQFDPVMVEALARAVARDGWEPGAPDDQLPAGSGIGFDHEDPIGFRLPAGVDV